MNEKIINNLYELWSYIGELINSLKETSKYSTVSVQGSDWPNRTFNIKDNTDTLTELSHLSKKREIPQFIVIPKNNKLSIMPNCKFVMKQKNMALDVRLIANITDTNPNIKQVKTENDAILFAKTASKSFGYKVDFQVINRIIQKTELIRLFIYEIENKCLGCGLIFFDSNNIAGLHMIGTLPQGRGKGIGKSMTEQLLQEAKKENARHCVLHASVMGEPIYRKFGFEVYGEIETYRIIN